MQGLYCRLGRKELLNCWRRFDLKRAERDLVVKGLAPTKIKHLFVGRKILKMRYADFPIPTDISIFQNKVAFIAWGDKPVGYLIRSQQIYEMFRSFFNSIWDKLKK